MRRARASVSEELQTFIVVLARFSHSDLKLAQALHLSAFHIEIAARMLGTSSPAARQQLVGLVRRMGEALPGYRPRSGTVGHEVSYDQHDIKHLVGVPGD